MAVFVCGLFSSRLGPEAALRALISGHLFSILLAQASFQGLPVLYFTLTGGLLFALLAQGWPGGF